MTGATVGIAVPTRAERRLLDVADLLVSVLRRCMERRARRRALSLDLLREQQASSRHDPRAVDHLLAQCGAPGR